MGNIILTQSSNGNAVIKVHVGDIAKGIYFLQIIDIKTNKFSTKKIITF